jgi:hypothetical protein
VKDKEKKCIFSILLWRKYSSNLSSKGLVFHLQHNTELAKKKKPGGLKTSPG